MISIEITAWRLLITYRYDPSWPVIPWYNPGQHERGVQEVTRYTRNQRNFALVVLFRGWEVEFCEGGNSFWEGHGGG
jgi:hypothetical protein